MKKLLLFAFVLVWIGALPRAELLAQQSRTVWVIEFLNNAGRVTGSSTYSSSQEAQQILAEIRKGNRNLGWGDVPARIVPRQIQADIIGGKEVWPVRIADQEAQLEEKVGYMQRLLADTELSELERRKQTLKTEKGELESLRDAIVRDTNGLLSEPEEGKPALLAGLEKMVEEYKARQQEFEAENARLAEQIRKFEQKKSTLLQAEAKLDLAEPYIPGVVSLRRRSEQKTGATTNGGSGNASSERPKRPVVQKPNQDIAGSRWRKIYSDGSGNGSYIQLNADGTVTHVNKSGDTFEVRKALPGTEYKWSLAADGTFTITKPHNPRDYVSFRGRLVGNSITGVHWVHNATGGLIRSFAQYNFERIVGQP